VSASESSEREDSSSLLTAERLDVVETSSDSNSVLMVGLAFAYAKLFRALALELRVCRPTGADRACSTLAVSLEVREVRIANQWKSDQKQKVTKPDKSEAISRESPRVIDPWVDRAGIPQPRRSQCRLSLRTSQSNSYTPPHSTWRLGHGVLTQDNG
jgi:hypothetical protein